MLHVYSLRIVILGWEMREEVGYSYYEVFVCVRAINLTGSDYGICIVC